MNYSEMVDRYNNTEHKPFKFRPCLNCGYEPKINMKLSYCPSCGFRYKEVYRSGELDVLERAKFLRE